MRASSLFKLTKIPIRDWNIVGANPLPPGEGLNSLKSLLGIETFQFSSANS